MPPPFLGHYRLDDLLGQGGMGEVYRAFDTRLNRRVAVKVMRSDTAAASADVERFLREARAASALNHPNIVTIHDVGDTGDGGHFIVQELVEGRVLRSLVTERPPLSTVADIIRQVAHALSAAHGAGIVHRDIKPENIMMRGDGYVKVLDFGVARMVDIADSSDTTRSRSDHVTEPGKLVGTTSYMAPEQARAGAVGTPADIFALGVTFYELVSGERPFVGGTSMAVLAAILSEQPVPLGRLVPSTPQPIDALVHRMLSKNPDERPSAREVEDALASMASGDVLTAAATAATRRTTVGREAERDQLRRALARARDGQGLLMAVAGEAGIGKTSLVEDFLAEAMARPDRPTIARGRCSERLAGSEAYLPILDAFDHLQNRHSGDSAHQLMKAVAPTWYLQVATGLSEQSGIGTMRFEAQAASQERLKREAGAFLHDLARAHPVVLFLDDLHWADASTVDLVNYLASRFAGTRLLVLTTYRPSEMARGQHAFLDVRSNLQARGLLEELSLQFLSAADVSHYLALEFPEHAFPPEFAGEIFAKTEGNPLFMADLVRYLRDSGRIAEDRGRWRLSAAAAAAGVKDLPESVRSMIERKIQQLEERDRKLLLAAAVQGPQFDTATLSEAAEMDPADVEDRLDVLARVHVFVERGSEREFPDLTLTQDYRFVHVLYQNALYASLQPARRAALSGRVARSLVARHAGRVTSGAASIAVLFEAARDFASSAQYYFLAAKHSAGLYAFRESLSLAERGLDGLRGLPEGPERVQLELGLQMIRGHALRMLKGWATPELEPVFTRARQLCHALADPPELVPVLWALTLFYAIRGDLREYRERADEVMRKAEQSDNPAFMMGGYHLVGVCGEFMGDMVDSRDKLDRGSRLHDPSKHFAYTAMYGLDPGMIARAMLSRPTLVLGFPDQALAQAQQTLAIARSQRQPMTLAFALLVLEGVHLNRGEAADVIGLGDEVIELAREYGVAQEKEWGRAFQGVAFALLGDLDRGIEQLKDSIAVQQAIGSGLVRSAFLGALAELLTFGGRVEEARRALEEAFAHAARMSEGGYIAELHRAQAQVDQASGKTGDAEASYRKAMDYASQQQAKTFELRAATGLARLLLSQQRGPEGRAALKPVYDWFTEGHSTADLVTARATLDEIA